MERGSIIVDGIDVPVIACRVCVVGSGAASLNGAVHLKRMGVDDVVVVTERLGGGTSANAGSDKQTYCRTNPAAEGGDGVLSFARDLFSGGAMHGDIALVEAALSQREFFHLVELGVPFPHDRYGVYPGYRTDHDSVGRGISAGPRTSIEMFQHLYDEVRRLSVPIVDNVRVIGLIVAEDSDGRRIRGVAGIREDGDENDPAMGLVAIRADYVIFGVGGPAGLYRDSVYPKVQIGGLGAPLLAGARARNLTESQFGIASVGFRWNLSGSYQQVLPRYLSTEPDGTDPREFLADVFPAADELFAAQFLKGYQWPFDVRRVKDGGSSLIDLAVFRETHIRKRRVYLDFTENPRTAAGGAFDSDTAPPEVRDYLFASGATGGRPVDRLRAMNEPAYRLFLDNDVDLARERLPVAVCHQHVNGGLAGSSWWESNIRNFFPVGEASGTHGVNRPGGSALNAGQVGSLRAAQMIAHRIRSAGGDSGSLSLDGADRRFLAETLDLCRGFLGDGPAVDPAAELQTLQGRMSRHMGIIRDREGVARAMTENREMLARNMGGSLADRNQLTAHLVTLDLLRTEAAALSSMACLLEELKGPRGSFLLGRGDAVLDGVIEGRERGVVPDTHLDDRAVECVLGEDGRFRAELVRVRPIPEEDRWFETVWSAYRKYDIFS
ncbi:MAG: FAD-binding protein [Deltaproteobacteria bacterium]|nr:FAD-binding protein [Candidatus Zymogenaceae bacterium]